MTAPPFAPGDGRWAHVMPLVRDPLGVCTRARATGPVVALRIGRPRLVLVNDPAAVRRLLVEHATNYQKTTRGYTKLRMSLGNGLITSEGEFWLRQRRIAQPAFHKKALAGFAALMARFAASTADTLAEQAERADGGPVDVVSPLNRMALDIVAEALFGTEIGPIADRIERGVNNLVEPFWLYSTAPYPLPELVPRPLNWRFWTSRWALRRTVTGIVTDARRRPRGTTDLMAMLMAATDPETGEAMSNTQLIDEALTIVGAGHETTANALAFAVDLLARHPEVADRVAAEAEAVLGDGPVHAEGLGRMVYTRQVLDETLRLYPPVWVLARQAVEADELAGFTVEAGTITLVPVHALHHDPALWPDPERFDPERFAPSAPSPDRGAYLPYSRGRRQCIGDRFAQMEAVCALAIFCRRFVFEAVGDPPQLKPALTLRPAGGIPVRLRLR